MDRRMSMIVFSCALGQLLSLAPGCSSGGVKCPEGLRPGKCGLDNMCVMCMADGDCPAGQVCVDWGWCAEVPLCVVDADCESGEVCAEDHRCSPACATREDCPGGLGYGCNGRHCYRERCTAAGICPAGWEPIADSLECRPAIECPEGTFQGLCGLEGRCVECIVDSDCGEGELCLEDGTCKVMQPCGPDNPCPPTYGYQCAEDGRCRPPCSSQAYCPEMSLCKAGTGGQSYCHQERCTSRGACQAGWKPVEGSLACAIDSCEHWGFKPGGCGLVGRCIECITDADCIGTGGLDTCIFEGACVIAEDDCWTFGGDEMCRTIYHERAVCYADGQCAVLCQSPVDCPPGLVCDDWGRCRDEWCTPEGVCPEGWKPGIRSLKCYYDPCPDQGLVTGLCGLSGQCVECITDEHCPLGICGLSGACTAPECVDDGDCGLSWRCREGRCEAPCLADEDCGDETAHCDGSPGFCRTLRCDQRGFCEIWGWQPIAGTLACRYDPCYWLEGTIPGVCGMYYRCIQCILDEDCPPGKYCAIYGECLNYPECDEVAGTGCPYYLTCVAGRCEEPCATDFDCQINVGVCLPEGYCYYERCDRDWTCPEGWRPGTPGTNAEGTLACIKMR